MQAWRSVGYTVWQRIPETMRVLGVLAVLLDLAVVPSLLAAVWGHGLQTLWPWNAWAVLGTQHLWHTDGFVSVALLGGALYWGYMLQKDSTPGTRGGETAFGSARWRTARECAQSLDRWQAGQAHNPAGLVAGALTERGPVRQAWVLGRDGHNIVLGAPGAGKSLKVMLPSGAVIAESGQNLVINDPKGELQDALRPLLTQYGYTIHTLDLRFPPQSMRWNPLWPIRQAMAEKRWADATKLANDLANVLATQGAPGGETGAFFQQSARAIGMALALLVADQAPPEACHVASMYHVLTQHAGDLDAIMQGLPLSHPARQAYGPLLTGSPETRQNQMSVVAISLSLFADPNIAWLTGAADFTPETLLQPKTAVFIVVPDDTTTYYPLASLFVTQVLQALAQASAARTNKTLAIPVHMILDEFGNLPKIPDFDKTLAVARGRGIRITMTLQSLSQLDDRYGGSAAKTMRNTCNTWIYLSANDPDTARIVSEKIGQTTIATTSYGQNWQKDSRSRSENTNATGRALLTADEVLRWRSDHTLVLQAGQMPAKFPARFWHDWPQYPESAGQAAYAPPAVATIETPPLWTPPVLPPDAGLAFDPDGPVDPARPPLPITDAPRWNPVT